MEAGFKTKRLRIGGMTCISCQNKVQKNLRNTAGIIKADVSYNAGTAVITYDTDIISIKDIVAIIQRLDYEVLAEDERQTPDTARIIGLLIIIVALYIIMEQFGILNLLAPGQLADSNMEYGMLFVIGLVTSVHCVAMCGGINLTQCIPKDGKLKNEGHFSALRPAFLYNLGRVISYTAVGFIVGALGSTVTFSTTAQGVLKLIAGVFMVIMGINMLGLFPWLRKLNPRMPKIFTQKINEEKSGSKSPLYVGMLNGLMPCGPLQAMQIYALSTGSPFAGALSMMLFSLGTVPLMFGFGALSSILSRKFTKKIMTVGAVLVAVLGLSMLSQGWSLTGFGDKSGTPDSASNISDSSDIVMENGVQIINSTLSSGRYPAITVQVGIPVKWIIDAPQGSINGCNNRIIIQEYDIEYTFTTGENIIEFTPAETGTFPYSCWMGMIRSSITVVGAGTDIEASTEVSGADDAAENFNLSLDSESDLSSKPIPTDKLAIATVASEDGDEYQQVTIELTDNGFDPAVIVVQAGLETEWIIKNSSLISENLTILVPFYNTALDLVSDENLLYLYPTESFDFSNEGSTFYGYVKVVDDIKAIDSETIKEEVRNHQTLIWPSDTFQTSGSGNSGGASCH